MTPSFTYKSTKHPQNHATEAHEVTISTLLNWLAVLLAFAHFIFGTLVFSSILLIGTLDAFGVLSRYLVSALVCRGVIMLELWGMGELP
jgi:hypothetical protein